MMGNHLMPNSPQIMLLKPHSINNSRADHNSESENHHPIMIELSSTNHHQASTSYYIKGEHDPAGGLGAPLILGSVSSSNNNSKFYLDHHHNHIYE